MFFVSMLRIIIDVGVIWTFAHVTEPNDAKTPYCIMMQFAAVPFTARIFPDVVTLGTRGIEVTATNATEIDEAILEQNNSYKFFLNISTVLFMYVATIILFIETMKAQKTGNKFNMLRFKKIFFIVLYASISFVWVICNTETFHSSWALFLANEHLATVFMNIILWISLLSTISAAYCIARLLPPRTVYQCKFMAHYLGILNLFVWFSMVCIYYSYKITPGFPPFFQFLDKVPIDDSWVITAFFFMAFMLAPPYRYRVPCGVPKVFRRGGGTLPQLMESLRLREMTINDHVVKVKLEVREYPKSENVV